MVVTYKYRIKDRHIRQFLMRCAWSVNQVWNFCVETQKKAKQIYKYGGNIEWLNYYKLNALTHGVSKDLNIHAQTIQEICDQFVKSRNLYRKCPKFRVSSGSKKSLGWVPFQKQSWQRLEFNAIKYRGKIVRFFGAKRRPLPTEGVKGGCFVEDSRGDWSVCFQVEAKEDSLHGTGKIGVDLGLKYLVTCSNGDKFEAPKYYRKSQEKLKIAQKSNNKKKIRAIHVKIKNQRQDFLHKLSNKLVRENETIIVGDVSAAKLAKTRMAKSVYDAGWAMLRLMLRYKASRHGAQYREVDESYTSQTCSVCGCLPPSRPKGIAGLGIREWKCSDCGTNHDRDINAAKNILALGLSAQPPVEGSWPVMAG